MSNTNTFRPTSICIKRVHNSVTDDVIAQAFLNIFEKGFTQDGTKFMCTIDGESPIEKIDMNPRIDHNTHEEFWLVFIHFKDNLLKYQEEPTKGLKYQTEANKFSTHLELPNVTDICIPYCNSYFFKCLKNTSKPKVPTQKKVLTDEDYESIKKVQKERAASFNLS